MRSQDKRDPDPDKTAFRVPVSEVQSVAGGTGHCLPAVGS